MRRSTKGMGTNEGNLVNTLCNRTKKQIDAADLLYHKTVCDFFCVCVRRPVMHLRGICSSYGTKWRLSTKYVRSDCHPATTSLFPWSELVRAGQKCEGRWSWAK